MILNYKAEPPTSLGYIHDVICWTVGMHRPAALPLTLHRGQADNSERPSRDLQGLTCATSSSQRIRRILERSRAAKASAVGRSMGELLVQADRCFLGHLDDRYGRRQGRGRSVLATAAAAADFSNRLRTICLTHTGRPSRIGRTEGRRKDGGERPAMAM